jgi:hypothetical protein
MGCCGKAREAARSGYASVTPEAAATPEIRPGVAMRHLGASAILIRGPRTGRAYAFHPGGPDQVVDPRDAEVLLRMEIFRRA